MFVFLVYLVLAAVSVDGGVVLGLPDLYNNYHGEYAAVYDNYEPRPYAFEYGVSDPHTGDHKTQWETKDKAGVVRGSYSLLEPDGSTRIVDYVADDHGFRAVVKKIGIHGQSVESHGGAVAVEGAGLVQPIVVADIEPVHVEEPIHVAQPLPVQQQLPVQQSVPLHQPVYVEQAPVFQSYDGGVEHYQNLFQHQQPYNLQYPNAEGIYVETPKNNIGGYVPYVLQPELNQVNYIQQVPATSKQEIYLPQAQAAPAPASVPSPAAPNAEIYYSQLTEFGNPQGKNVVTFQQPQGVLQENHAAVEQQQAPAPIQAYNTQLPVESYQLEQNFPGQNHILVQSPGYGYIPKQGLQSQSGSSQSVQGITGNLGDDSAYINYAHSGNTPLVLNEGERLPQSSKYGQIW